MRVISVTNIVDEDVDTPYGHNIMRRSESLIEFQDTYGIIECIQTMGAIYGSDTSMGVLYTTKKYDEAIEFYEMLGGVFET